MLMGAETLMTTIFLIIGVGGWSVICVVVGVRIGRMTIDKPNAPLLPKKPNTPQIEEDPYYEPFHGTPQPRIPTIPGE